MDGRGHLRGAGGGRASNVQLCNPVEAAVVAAVVLYAVQHGCSPSSIGVISPYRSQLRLLRAALAQHGDAVEVCVACAVE